MNYHFCCSANLRWPEPICLRNGYIFESRFLAEKIKKISLIFGSGKEKCSNFKKMLFILQSTIKISEISPRCFEVILTFLSSRKNGDRVCYEHLRTVLR